MGVGGNLQWETNEVFNEDQVEAILDSLHMSPVGETETNFQSLCPFHNNTDTPAFSISKETGLYMCFAPHCGARGNLLQLVERVGDLNSFQARRLIEKHSHSVDLSAIVEKNLEEEPEFPEFSQQVLDKLKANFWDSAGYDYMKGRGFTDESLDYFDIGYSVRKHMVAVPMHDPNGNPVGLIGRSISGKAFKNSYLLPKGKTTWNFHRAKYEGDTAILCESSFDAIRIHQAGFKNVVALLGGYASKYHVRQLNRSFSTMLIMTDNDEAGRKLASSIESKMTGKKILYAACSPEELYPRNVKDASDMTDDEIRQVIRNAISPIKYDEWYN